MSLDLKEIVAARLGENYQLHERHVNRTLVAAQRVIGFDKVYARAEGAYLYDMDNQPYLDFLSGYSVFNIGRNHPVVKQAIRDVLDLDLPNMVQMDCSLLSGLLAEAIVKRTPPHLDAVFFCNSGTEAMEGALKFARAATGRKRVVSLASAFHGLSLGSLSLMGCESFTEGFGPLMEGFDARVPLDDIEALDRELRSRDVAAFVIETVQGKGCQTSKTDFFVRAQELCRKYGTLLISDEVQTGLGRTGKMFGFQHWNLEPDIITLAKTLSGGYVPCGAIVTRREIYQKTFTRMDRCVVHSTTFGRNNLAMACGLGCAGNYRSGKSGRERSENGRVAHGKNRWAARETFLHQRSAWQRPHGRHRVSRTARIQAQDGVEAFAQDRQGALRADDRDPNVEQASHPHAGGRSRDGRDENSSAAHHRRKRSRHVRQRARRRAHRMPQISRTNVGTWKQFCPCRARFAQIR